MLNDVFTWVFFCEWILKIIGLGPNNYFRDNFNLFDSIVVAVSLVDYALNKSISPEDLAGATDVL